MTQQKALFLLEKKGEFAIGNRPIPKVEPGLVLVKIEATALNPVDWKIQRNGIIVQDFPAILGLDAAGIVEEVGQGVTNVVKGDRVVFQGSFQNDRSTFQQFTTVPAEIVAKIPTNVSPEQAASIPSTLATAVLGLYVKQPVKGSAGLYPPWEQGGRGKYSGKPIVVFGGSSSIGQFVIQLAKLSGFSPIITTASPQHSTFLESLGATHFIDRNTPTPELEAKAKTILNSDTPLDIVYDAVSLPDTQRAGYQLLAKGGVLVTTLFPVVDEETAKSEGKRIVHVFGNVNDPNQRELGKSLYSNLTGLLEDGTIQPNRVEVLPNGLQGIVDGLKRLENGSISGIKLVAHPQETV
ncbi:hypothetical protein JAAARDRAFT_39904 [Jaapia argillacea MUCL 33604]|uniref:Enoyl reductase (ER) domain-containing protein n=1 Tax=Jaapia argillacea MUCL 33604 TaxID=933084 RepID=A0A067PD03_9AGAM|nr:hypothetical protein JAAARDRAFT_39904 [Jaapia argillacea MUCL 33604]